MSSTTSRFVRDLNQLIATKEERQSELGGVSIEPILAVRGISEANHPPIDHSEGGIASPLVEIPGKREYYPQKLIKSSDGLFVIEQQALKKAVFIDANGNEIDLEFSNTE